MLRLCMWVYGCVLKNKSKEDNSVGSMNGRLLSLICLQCKFMWVGFCYMPIDLYEQAREFNFHVWYRNLMRAYYVPDMYRQHHPNEARLYSTFPNGIITVQ